VGKNSKQNALRLLLVFVGDRMRRTHARCDAGEVEEKAEREKAERVLARYQTLREQFASLRDRSIRRFQAALDRVEGNRNSEAVWVLQALIDEFEKIELPPLE
jgi:hypothetical protein